MTDQHAGLDRGPGRSVAGEAGGKCQPGPGLRPGARFGVRKKQDGQDLLRQGVELLAEYQDRLAAQDTFGVLVVLQAIDAAGKDSTIRHVMSGVNPRRQGVHLRASTGGGTSARLPVAARPDCPPAARSASSTARTTRRCSSSGCTRELLDGEKLPPESRTGDIWKRRYREINDWEHYLADNGIRVVRCSSTCPGRSSGLVSCAGSTSRRRTGSSPPATCANAVLG